MNFWWCNQGGPYWQGEREAGLVCAQGDPIQDMKGDMYRKTVGEVKAGDIILHYRKQEGIVAFSRAREDGRKMRALPKVDGDSYGSGWCFRTEYHDLTTPINKSEFVADLIPLFETGYAVNTNGKVKQAYFPRFNRAGFRAVLKHVSEPIPDWLSSLREPRSPEVHQTREQVDSELAARIEASRSLSDAKRKRRIAAASDLPEKIQVVSTGFRRNADVIVSVLKRANGLCEKCREKAPFLKRKDRSPYLEVHHSLPLSQGGKDKVENAVALCPNCHREEHHG
jgi:hypothetical protein